MFSVRVVEPEWVSREDKVNLINSRAKIKLACNSTFTHTRSIYLNNSCKSVQLVQCSEYVSKYKQGKSKVDSSTKNRYNIRPVSDVGLQPVQ